MTTTHERLGRYITALAATGAVFLVGAAATGAAQSHGGGAMGGWGIGGWLFWPLLVVGLLALAVVWAAGREGSSTARARTGESDPALEALRERYARGDISEEEFERRRRKLHTRG
ncbi:SHOCT domain-containing protein [Natronococcus sp.]|uniref:SHOCT domain-containing protein n=1 Tax=Natronococcus sp. TaxID=35747 RepID=UPI003A4DFBED